MKRNVWKIVGIGFMIFYFIFLLVIKSIDVFSDDLEMIFAVAFILMIITTIILSGGIRVVRFYIDAVRNMRSCGDQLFEELDEYKQHCGETKEHYQDVIRAITFYYLPDGKVDKVVGKDLTRLFARADYLKREIKIGEHFTTCITSIGLSVVATCLIALDFKTSGQDMINMVIGFLVFFAMLLLPYNNVIKGGSNEIYHFEMSLLEEKIRIAEEALYEPKMNEKVMKTKKNVLNVLGDKYVTAFWKSQELLDDIRQIEKMDLHEGGIDGFTMIDFVIGKTKRSGVLLFNEKNQLANASYKRLYKILRKYNLIYKIEGEEE